LFIENKIFRDSSAGRASDCEHKTLVYTQRHGITQCVILKSMKEKRTYSDRAEYMIKAVAKRRKKLKEMAIEYKGGKCIICGYKKCVRALNMHHEDPSQKEFGLSSRGLTRSWEKVRRELDKCVLLCSNCHHEVHDGISQLPKET